MVGLRKVDLLRYCFEDGINYEIELEMESDSD